MHLPETDRLFYGGEDSERDPIVRRAVATLAGYDDGELFLEHHRAQSLVWDDGRLRTTSFDTREGFGLRVVQGEEVGFAHGNEISERAVKRAAERLSVIAPKDTPQTKTATSSDRRNRALYADEDPTEALSFARARDLVAGLDKRIREADEQVRQVTISCARSYQAIQGIRAGGARYADLRPLVRLSVSVVMERNGRRESGSYGFGGRGVIEEILTEENLHHAGAEALRQARVNLESVAAPAGQWPVVLGGGWPGILLHEAIGHGLEGDFNRKGLSAFSQLMGEKIAAPEVTILDDGTLQGRRGSLSVDDEGTPPQATVLVEDGVLRSYMQDRTSARLMGVAPTGNGRRESFSCAPMVRMTNTYMRAGREPREELIARVKDGIYAVSFGGGQVNITNGDFTFACTEAYRIRGGKVAEPLKGASLIGNGAKALLKIEGVGNDFALDPGIGSCGKNGQWVPVGVGQPSMLISSLTVGGTASG